MSPDYKTYLATNVLNEGNIVTYRLLSHEFKIHANLAKQMLYDFHTAQNAKKLGSVHATYLVSGLQESTVGENPTGVNHADGEGDVPMPSSPYLSSSMPQEMPPAELRRVLTLVREEGLERVKAKYKNVTAVHVYSLESASPKDIQVLAQPNRQIAAKFAKEDPLLYFKQYGVIQNPNVKRRTAPGDKGKAAPPPLPPAPAKVAAPKATAPEPSKQPPAKGGSKAESKPALKKETSDLFKSFAKAKPKVAKKEDVPMRDVSDDEGDEEPRDKPDMTSTKLKAQREDREQKLRALMDNDDQPMSNVEDEEEAEDEEQEPEPEPEPEPVNEPALQEAEPEKEEEPQVTVSGGRRRGKRKVMKKVTMKDEEGYLITKEEPVWEEFSEDEAPPPTQKSKPAVSSGKPKSSSAKGQGNIMSFFGKK